MATAYVFPIHSAVLIFSIISDHKSRVADMSASSPFCPIAGIFVFRKCRAITLHFGVGFHCTISFLPSTFQSGNIGAGSEATTLCFPTGWLTDLRMGSVTCCYFPQECRMSEKTWHQSGAHYPKLPLTIGT